MQRIASHYSHKLKMTSVTTSHSPLWRYRVSASLPLLLIQFSCLLHLICLSDSASVQISGDNDDAILESLASSKILMDPRARATLAMSPSTSSLPDEMEMTQLGLKSTSSSTSKSTPASAERSVGTSRANTAGNEKDKNNPPGSPIPDLGLISPLHVAQCRATCIQKVRTK